MTVLPHPDELRAWSDQMRRTYTIQIRHDLRPVRPWRLRPWHATLLHGFFYVGYPSDLQWSARTRDHLIVRVERKARRMAQAAGIADPIIRINER